MRVFLAAVALASSIQPPEPGRVRSVDVSARAYGVWVEPLSDSAVLYVSNELVAGPRDGDRALDAVLGVWREGEAFRPFLHATGSGYEEVSAAILDDGDVILAGSTTSPDCTIGDVGLSAQGRTNRDGWIAVYDLRAGRVRGAIRIGDGATTRRCLALACDADAIYVAGTVDTYDRDEPRPFSKPIAKRRHENAFLARLERADLRVSWLQSFGSELHGDEGRAMGLVLARDGMPWLVGVTSAQDLPTTHDALQPRIAGETDLYLARFDRHHGTVKSCTYFGGENCDALGGTTGNTWGSHVARLRDGTLAIGGCTLSRDFPGLVPEIRGGFGQGDAFLTIVRIEDEVAVMRSVSFGGWADEEIVALSDTAQGLVFAGVTDAWDFPGLEFKDPHCPWWSASSFVGLVTPNGTSKLRFFGQHGETVISCVAARGESLWLAGVTQDPEMGAHRTIGSTPCGQGRSTPILIPVPLSDLR